MSDKDRFPELTVCQAAAKAVQDFDARYQPKAEAIKRIAAMLERGGWGAVVFEDDYADMSEAQRIQPDIEPVSPGALRGDSIETIVRECRRLREHWEVAYAAVPLAIRKSAADPDRGASARRPGHPRRE
ncbi:MAG TPA: hypothetical protein VKI44_21445 [Acetobacteraceae bacterium]|nr:hypothetical protein [Acetobacteraceae bacterium]